MKIDIGNSPCSWGVEFADDPRNPSWEKVLDECRDSGYKGIELGPVGFLPEDPEILGQALKERELILIGGVIFRPFHEPKEWKHVLDGSIRTCKALSSLGGESRNYGVSWQTPYTQVLDVDYNENGLLYRWIKMIGKLT